MLLEVIKVSWCDLIPFVIFLMIFRKTRPVGFLLLVFLLYFHRTPKNIKNSIAYNTHSDLKNLITSPAFGKILQLDHIKKRIQIFLSVTDIHFQFAPCNCVVKERFITKGKYFPAFTKMSDNNSQVTTTYSTSFGDIKIKQVSGTLAHKIISFGKVGTEFLRGEKIGFIRFGSRVDISLPLDSKITVQKGLRVQGPNTIIANISDCY